MFTGPFGLRDATDVCGGDELPAEAVAAGLSLLAERSVLLADRPAGHEARFVLPVTLRAYGGQMLRRLGQDQEYAARHKRWQDDRQPHQGSPAGKQTLRRSRATGGSADRPSGRPGENTCIPSASPGSLFAYRFDALKLYVVDSGFVVD